MCVASPVQACLAHKDCRTSGFTFCHEQKCVGTGIPGTALECRADGSLAGGGSQNPSNKNDSSDKLKSTLTYAGIGIGAVAFLGLLFAVVRWRSNKKKRSRQMPDFADVDYGMSTTTARSKSHRLHQRQSEPRSSLGANGEGQTYPFSNRPAVIAGAAAVGAGGAMAAGAAVNDQDYYNDQYYDDSYAQHSKGGYDDGYGNQNGGGYDNYGYGQGGYDQGYDQQGYDQQGYYKEAGGAAGGYDGYDQHGNYVGDQNGYYDQQGYDYSQQHQDYQYPTTSGADASGAVVTGGVGAVGAGAMNGSGVAYPAEVAAVSPRRNGGAEMMSEQDFGNSAGGAGYGRHY